jgi:hypothetical protein
MHFAKNSVGHQVMLGKGNIFLQRFIKNRRLILDQIIIGQRLLTTGLLIILTIHLDLFQRINSGLGFFQGMVIDVGGVDARSLIYPFFF